MARTIEEIQDALAAVVDLAEQEERDLNDQELADIQAWEEELKTAQDRRDRSIAARDRVRAGREKVTAALVTKTQKGDDTPEAAFRAYLRTGQVNSGLQTISNAQSEGVPGEGGYLVPPELRRKIVERMKAFGGLANVVEEVTTDSGNTIFWPTIDDTANVGEVVEEGGTFSGGADLVFGQEELAAYSYMAGGASGTPLRISRELAQDAAFDIEGLVSRKLGERLARIQATHLVNGTGVKQPKGITVGKAGVQTLANNAIVYKDLLAYVHGVDPAYRNTGRCRWAFNDGFLQTVRGLLDTNGRPILKSESDGIANDPGGYTLLGYPVTIDQAFSNFNNASPTVNYGVFGDLEEAYVLRRVRSMELLVNPYSRMQNRQIEYSVWARLDGIPQNLNAYITMTGKT